MTALRESADAARLMANPANLANHPAQPTSVGPEISQEPSDLAALATLAISHNSPELLITRLMAAATRASDAHGDSGSARQQMRADFLATPAHLRADLLAHLRKTYGRKPC